VMLLYPILSVIPQELVFRSYIFHRYRALFPNNSWMVGVSAAAFGFVHIVLLDWVAPVLCFLGGIIFSRNYAKHHSLALVSIEHALYGCWVFTVGLGWYFYSGAPR
jgi:uncharacterized protein